MAIRKRKNETFREYIKRGEYANMLNHSRKIPLSLCIDDNLKGIHREMITLYMAFQRNGDEIKNLTKNIAGILNLDTEQEVLDAQAYLVELNYIQIYEKPVQGLPYSMSYIRLLNTNRMEESSLEVTKAPSTVESQTALF